MSKSFMRSSPILDPIVRFPLMSHNRHICFISSSRTTHLFVFPPYVLGMYLLSGRTFSITSSAFMMFLSVFLFYYTSWPGSHQRRKGPFTYSIQVTRRDTSWWRWNSVLRVVAFRKVEKSWARGGCIEAQEQCVFLKTKTEGRVDLRAKTLMWSFILRN